MNNNQFTDVSPYDSNSAFPELNDYPLDDILKEFENDELYVDTLLEKQNNFDTKYKNTIKPSSQKDLKEYKEKNFLEKTNDLNIFGSNYKENNSLENNANSEEKSNKHFALQKNLTFLKDDKLRNNQDLSQLGLVKNTSNLNNEELKNTGQKRQINLTNNNLLNNSMNFQNNISNHNLQLQKNNLPASFTREKSHDFTSRNKHSLKNSFNSKFSKDIKGRETIFFQLVSKQEIGIESNFFFPSNLCQIIKDFNGTYDRNQKIWLISFFNYLKIHEALCKILEKEAIAISLIDNLPLEFLSKIDSKILVFKPEGSKKQFTLDYSSEKEKSLYDIPPFMYSSLYNFQKMGIEFGISKSCRFLLADEMGVGKTIQAIGCTSVFQEDWPVLIICPSSLKYNWKDEISNWLKDIIQSRDMIQVMKTSSDEFKSEKKFYIISYDLCLRMEKKLQGMDFNFIIADEAHYLKSREAKRSKILLPLMQKSKRLILLSGTPIVARPAECFNLFKALRPDIFNKFLQFADRYCDPKNGPFGRDYTGSSNVKELNFILNNLMIRRLKKDVLSELPPKKRQKIVINTNDKVIKQIKILLSKSKIVIPEQVEGINIDSMHSSFSKAYTLTGQAKIDGIQEYLNYLIENDCKFLIFAHHKVVLDAIEEHVIKKKVEYMRIDGSIVNEKRHECVNKFQTNDNCRIAILAITACATGLTLTKASTVVFAEIYFTPAVMIQAEDRAHRIGQENNCVNVHYLIGKDTVDEIVFPNLESKFIVVSNALDAKKLNMDVQNVLKGGKGEIEIGKSSKNLIQTQKNNLTDNYNKIEIDKSGNKTKITDFFVKKSSNVTNSDLSSSKINGQKNIANSNCIALDTSKNLTNKSSTSKNFENINKFTKIEEDPLDDVLEGFLNDESIIGQIFDKENDKIKEITQNLEEEDILECLNKNEIDYFNIHSINNGKRSREQMNNINNGIKKKAFNLYNTNNPNEKKDQEFQDEKKLKKK